MKPKHVQRIHSANFVGIVEPEGVNTVRPTGNGWEEIELAVDSGASETVLEKKALKGTPLMNGEAYHKGVTYEVASGELLPNLGQRTFAGESAEGVKRKLTGQVCDINKSLLSVRRCVQAGDMVVFSKNGSYVQDELTGEKMELQERNGMYLLKLWVKQPGGEMTNPFTRRGS